MSHTLECIELTKTFKEITALHKATLKVQPGQLTALLGPSGCGKTTLLRLIAGFEQPDGGQVIINGRVVASSTHMTPAENRRVGMVFQEYALFQHMTVGENVAFGLRGASPQKHQRTAELLALVGLAGFEKRMPHELSGGQQQRVALARALAPSPQILLLDEPFSNLDTALRAQVRAEVRAILKATATTCIIVTHDQEEALSLADTVAVMQDGQILQVDTPYRLYHKPASKPVAAFVGESNFIPAEANGRTAACSLGHVALNTEVFGAVELLIRPESITLQPADAAASNAHVIWREFYGHDQRLGIMLHDRTELTVRLGPDDSFAIGQSVIAAAEQSAIAYSRAVHQRQ